MRDELYEAGGFLFVGERLVVPVGARKEMLNKIHQGHLGIQKCKERARRSVYWPGLNQDIYSKVSLCSECAMFANRQSKEPLMPHDTPTLPWYTVAMNIMQFRGQDYRLVVDCMSHFPELRLLGG